MRAPTERPSILLVFSLIAFFVVAGIGGIAYIDQHKRLDDPVKYAEDRCEAVLPATQVRTKAFDRCVQKERNKSTLASIAPLFVAGVLIALLGVAGASVGRRERRAEKELEKKLLDS